MTTNLETMSPASLAGLRRALRDNAAECFAHGTPETTKAAYQSDWRTFERFCSAHDFPTIVDKSDQAAELLALFVADLAAQDKAISTIRRRVSGVGRAYRDAGLPSPTEHETLKKAIKSASRQQAKKGKRPKPARGVRPSEVWQMVETCDLGSDLGLRNAGMIVTQYLGTMRRSEVVALNVDDVEICDAGAWVTLAVQKNHDAPKRRPIARDGNPRAFAILERWHDVASEVGGPYLLKSDRWGSLKPERLTLAGYDRAFSRVRDAAGLGGNVSTHSLRGGSAQAQARNGATILEIQAQGDWKTAEQAASYAKQELAFDNSPTRALLG